MIKVFKPTSGLLALSVLLGIMATFTSVIVTLNIEERISGTVDSLTNWGGWPYKFLVQRWPLCDVVVGCSRYRFAQFTNIYFLQVNTIIDLAFWTLLAFIILSLIAYQKNKNKPLEHQNSN